MKDKLLTKRSGAQMSKLLLPFLVVVVIVLLSGGAIGFLRIANATNNNIPPDKQKRLDQQQQEIATARAKPGPPKQAHLTPPPAQPASASQLQAGIVDMHQGPFPSSQFIVRNFWQGPVGSNWELVYAGAGANPVDQNLGPGALRIYTKTVDYIGTYVAPNNESPLTITAVNGSLMQLRTDTGKTLTFNLQTKQYS